MKQEIYTVRLLENKDFDKLPYENISDSLGFADPETGDCYIRKTGVPNWDMATIQHEIDELLANKSFHEDANGIRHKKFFKEVFLPYVAPVVAGIATGGLGSALGLGTTAAKVAGGIAGAGTAGAVKGGKPSSWLPAAAMGGLGGYGGAAAVPGFQAGAAASKAAGGGILGQTLSGLQSGLGFQSGAQKIMSAPLQGPVTAAQAAQGYTNLSQVPNILGTTLGALQGPVTAAQAAKGYTTLGQVPGAGGVTTVGAPAPGITPQAPITPIIPPRTPAVTPAPAAPVATTTGLGGIAKKLAGQLAGPLAISALTAGMKPPEFEMPASVMALEDAFINKGGLTELSQTARAKLMETIKARPEDLYAPVNDAYINASLRDTRSAYDRAAEQLDAQYNIAGVYGSGEHLAAKDKLREELANLESDFIALENDRRFELARTEQQNAVVTALTDAGLTEKNIMEIATLDVQTAAIKYGAEISDMQTIKDALSGIVSETVTGAFKPAGETAIE